MLPSQQPWRYTSPSAHINYSANGSHPWPENPISVFDQLRYLVGLDIFNAKLKSIESTIGINYCRIFLSTSDVGIIVS